MDKSNSNRQAEPQAETGPHAQAHDNCQLQDLPPHQSTSDAAHYRHTLRTMGKVMQMGLVSVTCMAIAVFSGLWLDSRFDSEPIFIIIFVILGIFAAIKSMMDTAKGL